MDTRVHYSGLVVAGIGFFLTRFTVSLAIYEDPVRFYLAGVVPLALGLGLAAFGVALAVADIEASLVRTTAVWCVVGAGTMLVLVVLTLLGSAPDGMSDFETVRSQAYLSNFLIGGSVGGTLTGLYAARNRRQRGELRRQANRLAVLNRLLRHEILNSVTVIRGYATLDGDENPEARQVIEKHSDAIEGTIDEVKYLTRRVGRNEATGVPVDLEASLRESAETVVDRRPDASVSIGPIPEGLTVRADDLLDRVFVQLLENAIVHGGDPTPAVEVAATGNHVRVGVTDGGTGLPERQRKLIETGGIQEFDDPTTGFGLNVVRLLVEGYRGEIETDVGDAGTTITVVLPRGEAEDTGLRPSRSDLSGVRPAVPHLLVTLAAAVIAGVFYGVASEALGGSVAGIGVFYGTANPTVGWITHEFHSVVFGFAFVSLVAVAPERYRTGTLAYGAIGLAWALVVWVVAAGFVAPIWLRLLGIPAPIPSFSFTILVSHLVWGLSLGVLTAWGYAHVAPGLARLGERSRRRFRSM